MSQNSTSNLCSEASSPFIFEQVTTPLDKKSFIDNFNTFLLVNTKPWANEHLPHPKDYKFESCVLPPKFKEWANDIREFSVRKDDVWILCYPKSGSNWLENIVWQLKNQMDFSKEPTAMLTSSFFECDILGNLIKEGVDTLNILNNTPSPRIIKSHLPPHLLPVELWTIQPKIIYISRNPKDAAISRFHMLKDGFNVCSRSIEEFFDIFLDDRTFWAPFHSHVLAYWHIRHLDNFLFLKYEEQVADRFGGIKKIAEFLECTHTDDELKQLTEYTSIGNMQKLYTKRHNNFQ